MAAGTEVPGKRLAALRLLERLRRQEIEARAPELGRLRAEVAALEAEGHQLSRRLAEESHVVSVEAAPYLGHFIRSVRARMLALEAQAAALRPRIAMLEDEVAAAYREQRSYEGVRHAGEQANARAEIRRQEQAVDDLVLMRWRRD